MPAPTKATDEYAIEVIGLHKSFKLPTEKAGKLKTAAVNLAKGIRGYKEQKVLKGIDFKVKKGEFFGIVGRNGSGKSTLLKIISKIYEPTKGSVKVSGKLVPFIELGVGFNPELTGRENVYLNGALLGFGNKEIDEMYDEIVDFAELSDFMDQKLKNYSSGMQVRLAFSLAIRSRADVLVLDEILAVGDEAFQRKCYSYFAKVKKEKRTVILVTHTMDIVQQFCTRAVVIEDGLITEQGNPANAAQRYRELNTNTLPKHEETQQEAEFAELPIKAKVKCKKTDKAILFESTIASESELEDPVITFVVNRDTGEMIYRWTSDEKLANPIKIPKDTVVSLNIEIQNIFPDGVFDVQLGVKSRDRSTTYAVFDRIAKFEVIHKSAFQGDNLWKPQEKFSYGKN